MMVFGLCMGGQFGGVFVGMFGFCREQQYGDKHESTYDSAPATVAPEIECEPPLMKLITRRLI